MLPGVVPQIHRWITKERVGPGPPPTAGPAARSAAQRRDPAQPEMSPPCGAAAAPAADFALIKALPCGASHPSPPSAAASASTPTSESPTPQARSLLQPPAGEERMGRRMSKGARNARMPGADRVRCRASRLALGAEGPDGETPIVPAYLLGQKKNHNGRKGQLNARRALMKSRMEMKTGVTTFGCMPGVLASIVYPLTQVENELLNGMGALALEDEPVALE